MHVRVGLGVHPSLLVALLTGLVSAGCMPLGQQETTGSGTKPPVASPPAPCTASTSTPLFCTSGTCPLLSDETIACPASGPVTAGYGGSGAVGIGAGPGGGGDLVFTTQAGPSPEALQEYVELGVFDGAGGSSFTVDTFPASPLVDTGGTRSEAGIAVVTTPQGTPVVLSTIDGGLTAAVGPAAAGGSFTVEDAEPEPSTAGGWLLGGAGVEPSGAIDVLLQDGVSSNLAHRDPGGAWSSAPVPYSIDAAAIAVDSTGVVYTAGWVDAGSGTAQLEVVIGSNAPVLVGSPMAVTNLTPVEITVGRNANGSPLPVVAFGTTLTLAVPDGKGGFTTIQPSLTVAQPYQDTCSNANSLSLGNCSCVATCSQAGDTVGSVQLVRDSQGDVYVAWLEVNTSYTYPVDKSSSSVFGQTVTCSCSPDLQNGSGGASNVGLQLERLVMSPSPRTEHRGTIPVPGNVESALTADGNGTIQLAVWTPSTTGAETTTLRRVVLDASKLP